MLFSDVLYRVALVAVVLIFKFQCADILYTPAIFFFFTSSYAWYAYH
jgi:hypothetical protein